MIIPSFAPVAQGIEQPPSKRLAAGSNPARRTNINDLRESGVFYLQGC